VKCTSALLHCTSLINEPRIVDALLPNDSAVEPESATEQAETSAGPTVLLVEIVYDDTTADFSQESSFNQSTSRQLTGNVES